MIINQSSTNLNQYVFTWYEAFVLKNANTESIQPLYVECNYGTGCIM